MAFQQLLPYEAQIIKDLLKEDGLLISAKGLGLDRILLNLIRGFCEPKYLVLILNTSYHEEQFIISELNMAGVDQLPKVVTNEFSATEREVLYQKGGVLFVTSRILVVDMLMKRLPVNLVSGIIVYRAHKLGESSQEGFILRLFRQENQSGFIKGLSDSPVVFMAGYAQVERVMKNLFVRNLFLWPRFHADVVGYLEQHKPEVEELHIDMTPAMNGIQIAILELIECCLRDLRKSNPSMDADEFSLENGLSKSFDKMLKSALDAQWHQLSNRTKQLVSDLKVLRTLLSYLTQYDCVTFNNFLSSLQSHESDLGGKSLWMFMDAANSLFVCSRERVGGKSAKKSKEEKSEECVAEIIPKWTALIEILREIEGIGQSSAVNARVLVCASDERTCSQLKRMLCEGAREVMKDLVNASSDSDTKKLNTFGKRKKVTTTQSKSGKQKKRKQEMPSEAESDITILPYESVVVIYPLSGNSDPYSLLRKLYELEPTYVVLYDMEMTFIRQLEVFCASRNGIPLRVYCMMYTSSVEEQRYLTTLRREKDAFELLIKQKAAMVIPEEREARNAVGVELLRDTSSSNENISSRRGGGRVQEKQKGKKIIVDMREFRSELPSMIHRRGIDIEPVTLEVGDYILSPDICVERKSLSDLIGSLNNGRLYNQALAMTRFYRKAILLIEFDHGQSFSLQSKPALSSEINLNNVSSKLALLTIHFPKLRIIWSQNPSVTADIFEDLKENQSEPSADEAVAVGIESSDSSSDIMYNLIPQDFTKRLPGIDSRNYRTVLNNVGCIADLLTKTESGLAYLLGSATVAKSLHGFLHKQQ